MPIYEYECTACGKHSEVMQRITDKPLKECRECEGELKKLMSSTSFVLKGSGWYADGYSSMNGGNGTNGGNGGNGDKQASGPAKAQGKSEGSGKAGKTEKPAKENKTGGDSKTGKKPESKTATSGA